MGFVPVHIEKVEIWSDVTIAGQRTNDRTRKDRATQPMDYGRLRWATKASLRFIQFTKISQNDEATYWLDRKGSVAEDCDNDRTHLCWCTRENLSYTGPAIWRNAFVHNDKQRGGATTASQCAKKLLHNVQEKKLLHNVQQSHSFHHNLNRSPQSTPIFNYHQWLSPLPPTQIFSQF